MSSVISTTNQKRRKDSYASSAKVGLTLRANGDENVQVFTTDGQLVQAGFDAPTAAPTIATGAAGGLPSGYVAYRYVYASSRYPNVEALVDAGGETWPRSNPSPASAVFFIIVTLGGQKNAVTVTKSGRSDVDKILIYRTAIKATAAEAQALSDAGELFYVGVVDDNAIAGTVTFIDAVPAGAEQLELDNYVAPPFSMCVYSDPYWWGIGSPELTVDVTLDGSTAITATANSFYLGRSGQSVNFDGITTGGFDGKGTYYFKYVSDSVAQITSGSDLVTPFAIQATGTTTMRVRGLAGTLYRSKPRNPFSWGYTQYLTAQDGSVIRVPQEYAFALGGRAAAIAVLPRESLLKIDVENPSGCFVLNLGVAGTDDFEASKRVLDLQYTCASHFAQFVASFPDGSTALAGIDASNLCFVKSSARGQGAFGSEVFSTMRNMVTSDDHPRLYHGVYDPGTELCAWWIKTAIDPNALIDIDTCLLYHAPSGQWSALRDMDITASASVYDPVTLETITLIGTSSGQVGQAFDDTSNAQLMASTQERRAFTITNAVSESAGWTFLGSDGDPGPNPGDYFDIGDTAGPVRVWFQDLLSPASAPAVPTGGRLLMADMTGGGSSQAGAAGAAQTALGSDAAFTIDTTAGLGLTYHVTLAGAVPDVSMGTMDHAKFIIGVLTQGSSGVDLLPAAAIENGTWALFAPTDGTAELWIKANAQGQFDQNTTFSPSTLQGGGGTFGAGAVGTAYVGLINCEARTYFQPSQTKGHSAREMWSSFRNVESDTIFFRMYQEFDDTPYGTAIVPVQTKRSDGSDSVNWLARDIPTAKVNQMGYRLVERGYHPFEVLGLNLKIT